MRIRSVIFLFGAGLVCPRPIASRLIVPPSRILALILTYNETGAQWDTIGTIGRRGTGMGIHNGTGAQWDGRGGDRDTKRLEQN